MNRTNTIPGNKSVIKMAAKISTFSEVFFLFLKYKFNLVKIIVVDGCTLEFNKNFMASNITQAIHAAFNVMFGMLETRPELCGDLHDNK